MTLLYLVYHVKVPKKRGRLPIIPCRIGALTVDRLNPLVLFLLRLPERICVEGDPKGFDGGAHAKHVILDKERKKEIQQRWNYPDFPYLVQCGPPRRIKTCLAPIRF